MESKIAIERALKAIKNRLVRADLPKGEDIELFLELFTIKDCLEELLQIREYFAGKLKD